MTEDGASDVMMFNVVVDSANGCATAATGLTGLGSSSSTVAGFGMIGSLLCTVTRRRSFSLALAAL